MTDAEKEIMVAKAAMGNFAEWLNKNQWEQHDDNLWCTPIGCEYIRTDELVDKFLES